jgi:hypothetical protein
MTNARERLTAEYHAWMRANGVDLGSADESVSLVYDPRALARRNPDRRAARVACGFLPTLGT